MTRATRLRSLAVAVLTALVLGGCTSSGTEQAKEDEGIPRAELPGLLCFGLISADEVRSLFPDDPNGRFRVHEYPGRDRAASRDCRIDVLLTGQALSVTDDGARGDAALADRAFGEKSDIAQESRNRRCENLTPLGPGLPGYVSNYGGRLVVPPCRPGGNPRVVGLAGADVDVPTVLLRGPDNRQRLADALVAMSNRTRAAAGCAGNPLPVAAGLPAPVQTPVRPDTPLCGFPAARWEGVLPAGRFDESRGLVQETSGSEGGDRSCRLIAGADGKLVFTMWIVHGYTSAQLTDGRVAAQHPQPGIGVGTADGKDWAAVIDAECRGAPVLVTIWADRSLQLPGDFVLKPPLGADRGPVCALAG